MVFSLPYKTQSTASDRGSAPAWEYVLSKRPRQRRSSESKIKKKKKKKNPFNRQEKRFLQTCLIENPAREETISFILVEDFRSNRNVWTKCLWPIDARGIKRIFSMQTIIAFNDGKGHIERDCSILSPFQKHTCTLKY